MKTNAVFSSFSVSSLNEARKFYVGVLGFELKDESMGLRFQLPGGGTLFLYPKDDHRPATFTVLNLIVEDIDAAADELSAKGVAFERYEGYQHDSKGIVRSTDPSHGPSIAWFKDPAGNIVSIIQDRGT